MEFNYIPEDRILHLNMTEMKRIGYKPGKVFFLADGDFCYKIATKVSSQDICVAEAIVENDWTMRIPAHFDRSSKVCVAYDSKVLHIYL